MTDLRAALESLNVRVAAAERKAREVRDRTRRPEVAGADLLRPLAAYHRAVQYRQRDADPEEERRLVNDLLRAEQGDGVSLVPVDPLVPAKGFRVIDRRETLHLQRVEAEANAVRAERNRFLAEYGDDLAAEERAEEMDRIRAALSGDDPDALRQEFAGGPGVPA